jgi:outer membrane lipoprotein-sorting protein
MKMENNEDFHHDDLLERAVDAVLRDPVPDGMPPERLAQLAAAMRHAAEQPYPFTIKERIKNMKPITKITVAAAVLIASVCMVSWLAPGGGPALAFADVAEALNKVHSATWKTTATVKRPNQEPVTITQDCMFLAPSRERMEGTAQGREEQFKEISIFDGQKGRTIALNPATKTAHIFDYKNQPPGGISGQTFEGLRSLVEQAKSGKAEAVENLGVETIDGRGVEGFRMEIGAIKVTIWADQKTSMPIRVEETASVAGADVNIVMTDFQIDVKLDESLFSLEVPPGYTVEQTMQLDVSKKPADYIVDTLKWAAENNDGVFPSELLGERGLQGIVRRAATTWVEKYGKDSPELKQKTTEAGMMMGVANGLLIALPPDAWRYAGKDVELNTPDRPIFWFKLAKKSANYQVIYADLSVKELPESELPSAPDSEGSPKP